MSRRTIKLLHVEDDPLQQRVFAHHLQSLAEFAFEITPVDGENRALEAFRGGKFDLVVLDYQLAQGDGLQLLQRLRQLDPIVPILAISGMATAEVAAELVRAGADDYFDKRDLISSVLAKRVRTALLRTDTVRKRLPDLAPEVPSRLESMLLELGNYYIQALGEGLLNRLDALEAEVKQVPFGVEVLEKLQGSICFRIGATSSLAPSSIRLLLRPLLLELSVRLVGELSDNGVPQ